MSQAYWDIHVPLVPKGLTDRMYIVTLRKLQVPSNSPLETQYQTSKITIDGMKKTESLSKLNYADLEDFKTELEINWK